MAAFTPVSNDKLYIKIYRQILDAIMTGVYAVGDKLPSEKELCQQFNVSRVPVREALCALELNGLVEPVQGAGVYVKSTSINGLNEDFSQVEPQEIIQARLLIEPEIARLAALNMSDEERQGLLESARRFRRLHDAGKDTVREDKAFHVLMARGCGNALYSMIFDMIATAMEHAMWNTILRRSFSTPELQAQNCLEHELIAQAIAEGRADEVYSMMTKHMDALLDRYWR